MERDQAESISVYAVLSNLEESCWLGRVVGKTKTTLNLFQEQTYVHDD